MWALSFTTILLSTTPCLMDVPKTEALALGLKTYVDDAGDVDYRRLALERTKAFTSFLDAVSGLCPEAFSRQSRDEKIALLLNFYNAWVIDFMTGAEGRPGSILKVRVKGQSVFDAPMISVRWHEKPLTLNSIEKVLLPGLRADPRYHFALVCGAKSCPKLRRMPYSARNLDDELQAETIKFLKDGERNQLEGDTWKVSRLFDWYQGEFGGSKGSVIEWIRTQAGDRFSKPKQLEFLEYDWSPNRRN